MKLLNRHTLLAAAKRFLYLLPIPVFVIVGVILFAENQSDGSHLSSSRIQQNDPAEEPEPSLPKSPAFEFPSGGRTLLPNNRFVALYGTPDIPVLGSLGEQPVEAAIQRVKDLAAQYQEHSDEYIYPTFEIITTIASASPTDSNDYSSEVSIEKLRPWIDAAKSAGVYVILDLQPGHSDFLSQAKLYESLLLEPHVGLALDPEWRLKPGQKHMKQIGSVTSAEINATAQWLAELTRKNNLPQKVLMVHQFKLSMITEREFLDTSDPELAWIIQMDGLGSQPIKLETWRTIRNPEPAGIHFGWKNFIDEDKPMLTPAQTMAIEPKPWLVSYQ